MSISTVSATVNDPSGQIFANGSWQLIFKPTPNTPGLFTDGGVPFTTLFGGFLDATGSFSQAGVARNDTIAPAGSKWTLVVSPNANSQAFSIDLNINSPAFNASALINAIILNIAVPATGIAHAYKDSEVIPVPSSGSLYYDETLKLLKAWDTSSGAWNPFSSASAGVQLNPAGNQVINQPVGTNLSVNRFENIRYADQFPGTDMAAKIAAAYTDLPITGGIVDATAFQGAQTWASNPFAGIAFGSTKGLYLKLGNVNIACSVQVIIQCSDVYVIGLGWQQTSITYTGGAISSFWKVGTSTPTINQLTGVQLVDFQISGNASVVDTLFITGCHHSSFRRLDLRNCTGAGLHTQFAVVNDYDNIQCTFNNGAFITTPTNGLLFDQIDANHQTTASTVTNPLCEGLSGSAIKIPGASGLVFNGGTGEQSNRGIEVIAPSRNNTFISIDVEGNVVEDVLENGFLDSYIGIASTAKIHLGASSKACGFLGGSTNNMVIDAGATITNLIDFGFNNSGTGTFVDNGIGTKGTVINAGSNVRVGIPWSNRDTIPSFTVPAVVVMDNQDFLSGAYTLTNVATIISNTVYTTGKPWRVIFIGEWESNFEGAGLAQPAPYIEVTNVAPTFTVGATTITVALNVSGQFTVTTSANTLGFSGRIIVISHNGGVAGTKSMTLKGSVDLGGLLTTYNNTATVGNGVPSEIATVDLTAQTAAITTTNLNTAILAAGQYRISWNAKVTTAAGVSSTLGPLTITYTDPDGVSITQAVNAMPNGGTPVIGGVTNNNTSTLLIGIPLMLNCKAGTNITYAFAYASNAANTMAYNLHIKLELMG